MGAVVRKIIGKKRQDLYREKVKARVTQFKIRNIIGEITLGAGNSARILLTDDAENATEAVIHGIAATGILYSTEKLINTIQGLLDAEYELYIERKEIEIAIREAEEMELEDEAGKVLRFIDKYDRVKRKRKRKSSDKSSRSSRSSDNYKITVE